MILKNFLQRLLHFEAAMIGANCDSQRCSIRSCCNCNAFENDVPLACYICRQRRYQCFFTDTQRRAPLEAADIVFCNESAVGKVRHAGG